MCIGIAVERLVVEQDIEPHDHMDYATSALSQTQVSIHVYSYNVLLPTLYGILSL